jgi:succinate dehydrogenase / fumarate reductase cytochrome b subunit
VTTSPAIVRRPEGMTRLELLFGTSVGQKVIMAATGIILSVFVLGHMVGNLTVFAGAAAINAYGQALRKFPALLWGVRLGLLLSVGLHIWAYLALTGRSWSARPEGYRKAAYKESTYASRTMRWTGPLLAAFIVYHLLHLTTGHVHPDFRDGEVYHNLVSGLQVTWVAVFYLLAMGALAFHLHHGVWSLFQSIGVSQPRYGSLARKFTWVFTILVVAGFAVIPIAVLAGVLKLS